jgi:DNA helicase II / ATP-dependent DNA helicase PcrA
VTFKPTPEQLAIVSAATSSDDNLLVSALAGAAKTSTLVLLAEALPDKQILTLAFNKKIAVEMGERLPKNCTAMTLSSIGYRSWRSFASARITLKDSKMYLLVKDWVKENLSDETEIDEFWKDYEMISSMLSSAKSSGYIPDSFTNPLFRSLFTDDEFFERIEEEPNEIQIACVRDVLVTSIRDGMKGSIDYDDMLYLPTLCKSCSFPRYQVVMIDEAQDLSVLNHHMLTRICQGKTRLIAVGDPCQSIYGFRGAHQDSMDTMKARFAMTEYSLTISFRCPRKVVEAALWRAPAMRYPEWAIEGEVKKLALWNESSIPPHAAIICRNNAPIISLAFKLLRHGLYPEIVGNDMVKSFKKILSKLGNNEMLESEALAAVDVWEVNAKLKSKNHSRIADMKACLLIFIEGCEVLGNAHQRLEEIFSRSGPIKLMTGHKAKGLEFPHVFLLDKHLLKLEDNTQEQNLLYVMQTRAQETLTYVRSADWPEEVPG